MQRSVFLCLGLGLCACIFCGRELQASPPRKLLTCAHTHAHTPGHTHARTHTAWYCCPRLPAEILSTVAAALWPGACGQVPSFLSLLIRSPKRFQAFPWWWWVSVSGASPQGFLPPSLPKSPRAAGRHFPAGPCHGAGQAGFSLTLRLLQRDLRAPSALPGRQQLVWGKCPAWAVPSEDMSPIPSCNSPPWRSLFIALK